jgi:PAS domain S-box-containing protein
MYKSKEHLQETAWIETAGAIFFNLDGTITDANEVFQKMSGYSREEFRTILISSGMRMNPML